MLIVLAAVLVGGAVVVAGMGPAHGRGVGDLGSRFGVRHRGKGLPGPRAPGPPTQAGELPPWAAWAASLLAGLAVWGLLGGAIGLLGGVTVAIGAPRLLARLEPSWRRRERMQLTAAAPLVADLLAASLAAGATLDRALPVIARALGGPVQVRLDQVQAHVRLGEPAAVAWARVADAPGLGGIARTVARSSRSGAPLAGMLASTADDLRAEAAAAALAEVRATSVRAVLPLGLCLLPAFTVLGVLPVVAGLVPAL